MWGEKKLVPSKAIDLYEGILFKAALSFVQKNHFDFVIISAKHAILKPEQIIAPYEMRVDKMGDNEYKLWALRVVAAIKELAPEKIVWLCPNAYLKLPSQMLGNEIKQEFPLKGLGVGRQIKWLKQS